jgi:tRNA A37 methylthiotransferase MiaB
MRIQIISTSCNRRELELEQVKNYFEGNGVEVSKEDFETDKSADVIVLSTCGFTQAAEDFGLKTLNRIEKEKKQGCEVIVGGCLPKINPEALYGYKMFDPRNYDKLDEYFSFEKNFKDFARPNTVGEWKIHTTYREHGLMESDKSSIDEVGKTTREENIKNVKEISTIISERKGNYRIQCLVGCACKCTYCAIKFAIGNIESRPIDQIVDEAKNGIKQGYKNILLEGDSLGAYGLDIKTNLGELIDAIIEVVKDTDVQISVSDVSPKYLELCYNQIIKLANLKKIFNFYIPIQSGSQKILDSMKRGYDINKTKELGTSIIVGFPGETLEDFEKTIETCKELKFDYIHCHSYSDRKGTEASSFTDKVPGEEILRRSRALKSSLKDITKYITIAEDTSGNRSYQG